MILTTLIVLVGSLAIPEPIPVQGFAAGTCTTFNFSNTAPSASSPASYSWYLTTPIYWKCDTGDSGQYDSTYGGYRRLPARGDSVVIDNYYYVELGGTAPELDDITVRPSAQLNMTVSIFLVGANSHTVDLQGATYGSGAFFYLEGSGNYYSSYPGNSKIVSVGWDQQPTLNAQVNINSATGNTVVRVYNKGSQASVWATVYNVDVYSDATLYFYGTATYGLYVFQGGTAYNYGTTAVVENAGTFYNYSTITGDIKNQGFGVFHNGSSSTIGNLTNENYATFNQNTTLSLRSGTVTLYAPAAAGKGFYLNGNNVIANTNATSSWKDAQGVSFSSLSTSSGATFSYAYTGSTSPPPALTISSLSNQGTFDPANDLNVSLGSYYSYATGIAWVSNDWTVSGSFTNYGLLRAEGVVGTTTVGGSYQDYGTRVNEWSNLSLDLRGSTNYLGNDYTIKNFTKTSGYGTLTIAAGKTLAPSNSLSLSSLDLLSGTPGSYWYLTPPATRSLYAVNVQDSYANSSINALGFSNFDSGHNVNWILEDHMTSLAVPESKTYYGNETVTFTVNWLNPVTITGTPRLPVTVGSTTRYATYTATGSTSSASKFVYTVQGSDLDSDGIALGSSLELNGGTIKDSTNNNNAYLTVYGAAATSGIKVLGSYTLTVTKPCTGTGTVTNTPTGTSFLPGTSVELSAAAGSGSIFAGWGDALSGTDTPKTFTINSNTTVSACFELAGNMTVDPSYTSSTAGWGVTRFASIQAAIDAALADTAITVNSGTYTGDVSLNNAHVTLKPADGVKIDGALSHTAGTLEPSSGTLTVTGDLTLGSGMSFAPLSGTLKLGGNLVNNGTFAPTGTSKVVFNGSGDQAIGGANAVSFQDLEIDSASATAVISSIKAITVNGGTTVMKGVLKPYDGSTLAGNVTIASGATLDGSGAETAGLKLGGNLANNGTFSAGGGKVTFNGGSAQSISGSSTTVFHSLVVDNSHGVSASVRTDASHLTVKSGAFHPGPLSSLGETEIQSGAELTVSSGDSFSFSSVSNYGTFSPTGGTASISGSLANHAGGTVAPSGGTITVGGSLSNAGSVTPSGGTLKIAGNLSNSGTFGSSGGTVVLNGSAAQAVGGTEACSFYNLIVNNSGSEPVTSTLSVTVANLLRVQDGTFSPASSSQFHDVTVDTGAELKLVKDAAVKVSGDWTNNGTFSNTGEGSGVTFNGSAGQTIGGSSVTAFEYLEIDNSSAAGVTGSTKVTVGSELTITQGKFHPANQSSLGNVVVKKDGTFTLGDGETVSMSYLANAGHFSPTGGTVNLSGSVTSNTGTFNPSGGTVNVAYSFTNTGSVSPSGGTVVVGTDFSNQSPGAFGPSGGTFQVGGDLLNSGTCNPTGGTLELAGDLINNGSFAGSGTSLVSLTGTGAQYIGGMNPATFQDLTVNNSGTQPVTTTHPVTVLGGLEVLDGIFSPAAGSHFKDILIGPNGTLNAPAGNLFVSGDFINNGSFLANSGTVTFDGPGAQTIGGNVASLFNNLVINSAGPVSSTQPVTVAGATQLLMGLFQPAAGSVFNNTSTGPGSSLVEPLGGVMLNSPELEKPIPDQQVNEGAALDYIFPADTFSLQSGTLSYTALQADGSALPTWLTFTPASRRFSGTPAASHVGSVKVTVTAHSSSGTGTAESTFTIFVQAASVPAPLLADPIADQSAIVGTAFTFTVPAHTFASAQKAPLTYSASGQPAWLTFTAGTRTFTGTPPLNANTIGGGQLTITVKASDAFGGSVSDSFVLTVLGAGANAKPAVRLPLPDQDIVAGELFEYTLPAGFAVDPDPADSLLYSADLADGGLLPAWLEFDSTARKFSGTPTEEGTFLVRVTVTDSALNAVSDLFRISVSSAAMDVVYLGVNPNGSAEVDGFGQVLGSPAPLPPGSHYYLVITPLAPAPALPAAYMVLGLQRDISLYDDQGEQVEIPASPLQICFTFTVAQWNTFGALQQRMVIMTAPTPTSGWTPLVTVVDPVLRQACALAEHFSLFDLVILPNPELPDTGFPAGRVTRLPDQPLERRYSDLGSTWLEVPALGLKQPIAGVPLAGKGYDLTWLGPQVGWLEDTAFPGLAGNSVLTGHVFDANGRPGPFRWLESLEYDSTVIVHASGEQYVYRVRSLETAVEPGESARVMRHEELPWLTLVTCRGYDEQSGKYRWRVVARAVLVEVRPGP